MEIDLKRQHKARQYAHIRRRLMFVDLVIAAISIFSMLWSGFDIWLRDQLYPLRWQPVAGWFPWQVLTYFLILIVGYRIIITPLSYYQGFVLPHRYSLSTITLKSWFGDLLKELLIGFIFEILAVEVVYLLLATQPQIWWLWIAFTGLLFTVGMANLGPVLILPLFYKLSPLPEGDLIQRLLALAHHARTRVRGVFIMQMSNKTTTANAALMGLGNTRRIVLGDTIIDRYTPDEIEVIFAHELGHHLHHDLWKLMISQSLLTLGGLYLINVCLHWAVETQHFYRGLSDTATIPFLLLLAGVLGLIITPVNNTYTRTMEYQADEYALQATGKVDAFKSAMTRLANQNLADVEPSSLVEFLFHNHPSINKRLKHADVFAVHHVLQEPSSRTPG